MFTLPRAHFFRASLLTVAALALPSCGAADQETPEDIAEAEQAVVVCAKDQTVEGIDVSQWQETVDWVAVKNAGIRFAIARVSTGTTKDTRFDVNWSGMKAAGLVRGAHQVFKPLQDPIAQADLMLESIGALGANDLPPVVLLSDAGGLTKAAFADKLKQWLGHVEAATGRKPIIQAGKYFWQDYVASAAFTAHPLWIPSWNVECPNLPDNAWATWTMHQYSSTGMVAGVAGAVDRNRFNGSLADLTALASGVGAGTHAYAAQVVSQSFPTEHETAAKIQAGGIYEATIEVQNIGTAAWDSNTYLATTEPRDRTSPFAGEEWPAPHRFARVEGTVAPGGTYTFNFTLHAPLEEAVYIENFGLVQEGVAWFGDQGGPADLEMSGMFEVVANLGAGGASPGGSMGPGGNGKPTGDLDTASACAVSPGSADHPGYVGLGFVLGMAALVRRRRRA
jgi:lysozyme